jgi:hypothetical protein
MHVRDKALMPQTLPIDKNPDVTILAVQNFACNEIMQSTNPHSRRDPETLSRLIHPWKFQVNHERDFAGHWTLHGAWIW